MYCGKLQKNTIVGFLVGSWVIYLIFTNLPLTEGGGVSWITSNKYRFNSPVEILKLIRLYTLIASSTTLRILNLSVAEINRIFGKFDESNSEDESMLSPFVVGEDVKVMDGPFNGFTGSIAQVFEDRKKVNVTVKIFGRNTPVELNYYQVEKSI